MKICVSNPKRFIPQYLLFCIIFVVLLIFLILSTLHFTDLLDDEVSIPMDEDSSQTLPVVVIDAGHGGEDGGAIGNNGVYEKDLNLQITRILNDLLNANGIPTVMTRTEDILLYDPNSDFQGQKKIQDLATRKRIAEQYEDVVFISIHMNAFPQAQYSGLQVYYSPNSSRSMELARDIQETTKALLLPENTRSIKPSGGNIYLLDRLQCPSVLIECGFLSNPQECERLCTEEYQQQMAFTICISVLEYLSDFHTNSQCAS